MKININTKEKKDVEFFDLVKSLNLDKSEYKPKVKSGFWDIDEIINF